MTALAILVAVFGAGSIGGIVALFWPVGTSRLLRVPAFGLTAFASLVLISYVANAAGPIRAALLGVPFLGALMPLVADWSNRHETAAAVVGSLALAGWGPLLGLGVGVVFLPSAALVASAAALQRLHRPANGLGRAPDGPPGPA